MRIIIRCIKFSKHERSSDLTNILELNHRFVTNSNPLCKHFSDTTLLIDALLASKRRPFGLQKVLFWSLINALLEAN